MISLDSDTAALLDAYRTCEFATLGRDGTPMAWPTAAHRQADGTLLITTSLAFAQKALNVRRDARVALLFSDPTGSGLTRPPQVFVSGTAQCSDSIVSSPAGLEDYWKRLFERQPMSRRYVKSPANRLMDWYYFRLLITVTPREIVLRDPLPADDARIDAASAGVATPFADLLARFSTAVLGTVDATGAPHLTRTTVTAAPDGFEVHPAEEAEATEGPASLLVHRHDEKLSGLYNALVCGRLSAPGDGRRLLVPERVIEPNGTGRARDAVRLLRTTRKATQRYLERRGLDRPTVPWNEYQRLARES